MMVEKEKREKEEEEKAEGEEEEKYSITSSMLQSDDNHLLFTRVQQIRQKVTN